MGDQSPAHILQNSNMELPAIGKHPSIEIDMSRIREAEARIIEAKTVNAATYADLEHTFNQSYRDLKAHLSKIGYEINRTEKLMDQAKADVLLDKYPEFLKENNMKKQQDNADLRKAFLMRDEQYLIALDRLNQLKALESNFDGKIKVMERVCAYMKLQMNLLLRSGMSGADYYVTSGRK